MAEHVRTWLFLKVSTMVIEQTTHNGDPLLKMRTNFSHLTRAIFIATTMVEGYQDLPTRLLPLFGARKMTFQILLLIASLYLGVMAITAVFFMRALNNATAFSPGDRINAWDVFAKWITTLAAGIGVLVAAFKYTDQRDLQTAQTLREFNIRIYAEAKSANDAKRIFLNEATDLVSTLATFETIEELNGPQGQIASDRFERLYHGQLVLYENEGVSDAMIDFRDALLKWRRTRKKPAELLEQDSTRTNYVPPTLKKNSDFLRRLALRLSNACEQELVELSVDNNGGA